MTSMVDTRPGSVIFISHGGGPLPLLGDPGHAALVDNLQAIAGQVGRPSAIVVFSAHWESAKCTITGGATPSLIYDYFGFPNEAYQIQYPAPGEPALAGRIYEMLTSRGMEAEVDKLRGFDHGMFVPLKIMFPKADIPCVQISLFDSLSPSRHIQLGRVLAGLREDNILVIGSGFSFHNLKAFFSPPSDAMAVGNTSFENWLVETCTSTALDEVERESRLVHWQEAPAARLCHPREEHLLPLHVCYGLAQAPARKAFSFEIMGMQASAYAW
ncbi:MAG: dioxygenase [Gammaproteobacteria bacterium]|nr:dioxygenase [Gammaproteobacteria bacterium]